ncbi:MAG: long-chain fatty acid--CoA ligase [Bacteroidales bacterium]|nr:long-chain fatty acid--CoA ligase [Bacteroidales bacterium]
MEVRRVFDLLANYKEKYPDQKVALAGKVNGKWREYSIDEYIELTNVISSALIELGVQPQDKVAVISNNRPEWNILDMAITQIGAVMVPIYPTISEGDYKIILNNCEAGICIVEGIAVMNKIEAIWPETPTLKQIYTFIDRGKYGYFDTLLKLGREHPHTEEIERRKSQVDEMSCATIIYTSGTTGIPKGVMLSHHNLMNQFKNFCQTPSPWSKRAFSFLPVCHAYERALIYMYHYLGMSIYYAESIATIADNMKEVHPTMMCAVPRVLEKFYEKIYSSGKNMKGISKNIFYWAMHLTERYKIEGRSWFYNLELKIADKLVYSKIREKLGAENFDIIVSGAASITKKISGFFSAIKMPVFEGYGLTETSPVITVSNRNKYGREVGAVGQPLPGVEVKIADNGEIICRGHNVMMGYYKQPELTAEVIDKDGWFHTGDLGKFNEHGLLQITGRMKNLFKTSLGKYVNPDVVEGKFSNSGFIEQIVVLGENQKFAAALIRPDFAFLKDWCKDHEIPYTTNEEMILNEEVKKRYDREVKKLNEGLGEVEKVKKYQLIADEWTIANGILTPTLKVKRKVVMERYNELIDKLFV